MAKLEFFLVARSFAIDQSTNSLSIFNVLEELTTASLPVLVPDVNFISVWLLDESERENDFQITVIAHKPDGTELGPFPQNFTATRKRQRMLAQLAFLPLDVAGDWRFELRLNGEHAANHVVSVQVVAE